MSRAPSLSRRTILGAPVALAFADLAACAPAPPPAAPAGPPPVPLTLTPLSGLVKAPGLTWMLEVAPRRALRDAGLLAALATVVPEARFQAFAKGHGGLDPRSLEELVIARYEDATLTLARVPPGTMDPVKVHQSFERYARAIEARAIDVPNPSVVRMFGDGPREGERVQLVTFGREAVALETGKFGPLRVAELYAQGKLRRAKPALKSEPLAAVAALLGEGAELRFFAAGPFVGEWERALGGLLRASTGVGLSLSTVPGSDGHLRAVGAVVGDFDKAPDDAARAFGAALDVLLAKNALGRMLGLDAPVESVRTSTSPGALRVGAVFDGARIARGLHTALDAEISEIMNMSR